MDRVLPDSVAFISRKSQQFPKVTAFIGLSICRMSFLDSEAARVNDTPVGDAITAIITIELKDNTELLANIDQEPKRGCSGDSENICKLVGSEWAIAEGSEDTEGCH